MHAEWAKSIDAEFISNTLTSTLKIPNLSRLLKSGIVIKKIPKSTDLLLCESGAEIVAGALWKRQNPNKKLVLIVDDPKFYYMPKMFPLKKLIYNRALSYYDLFLPATVFMKDLIPLNFQDKSRIVNLYVDVERYSSVKIDFNSKNIVFVGRVGKEKGVDRILKTFKIVQKSFPMSKLYIVGEGPLKNRLEKDKDENIVWTGWEDDPRKYLSKGTIYLNLARIEPAGVAILEAMCMGLVPIVSNGVGFKDVVKKISGDLVVNDPHEAARIVEKLWFDPNLLKDYSIKSNKSAGCFTKDISLKKFENAIMKI